MSFYFIHRTYRRTGKNLSRSSGQKDALERPALTLYDRNLALIQDRLVQFGPRKNLSGKIGISDGQLSKLLNGSIMEYCRILDALGLEIVSEDYLKALKTIIQKEIRP